MTGDDQARMRAEYARRYQAEAVASQYTFFNPAYVYAWTMRQRAVAGMLRQQGWHSLQDKTLLEVGCGRGDVLTEFLPYRLDPQQVFGMDILERVAVAKRRYPAANILQGDGQTLPYRRASFDIVLQYTVFSSVLDDAIKANIAREMLRVVKPDGVILWYDFWLNPTNPQTQGIPKAEIKRLFAGCDFTFKRTTLAPPLTRRLVPLSWTLSSALEALRWLNTHWLVAIRPRSAHTPEER